MLVAATPAVGQEVAQTPQGAQEFIKILAEQGVLNFSFLTTDQKRTISFVVKNVDISSSCVTRFNNSQKTVITTIPKWKMRVSSEEPAVAIDWSKASSIYVQVLPEHKMTSIAAVVPEGTAVLSMETNIGRRLGYALNFLKESCDVLGETGF